MDDSERTSGNNPYDTYKKRLKDSLDQGSITQQEFDECAKLLHGLSKTAEGRRYDNKFADLVSRAVPIEVTDEKNPQKRICVIPAKVPDETTNPKNLRTAAYCRVSTEKDEQINSLESQIDTYTNMIKNNPEWSFAGIFVDRGTTATNAKGRKGFQKMIKLCEKGEIDQIIIKSFARFARNTLDSLLYIQNLKRIGVNIIFENEHIQTKDVTKEFLITLYSGIAQAESEAISENAKWNWQKNFKQGNVHISYGNFLGYRKGADGKPEVDIDQAEIVRRIYIEYLSGKSFRQIAKGLQADNILSPEGKAAWPHSSIRSILKNEKYMGDALLQKTVTESVLTGKKNNVGQVPQYHVENSHPAIIDKETWTQVQKELAKRSSKPANTGKLTDDKLIGKYALSKLLFCGECGTPYRRCTWSKNGKKTIVWRCISRLTYGTEYCKKSPTLKENVLHNAILGVIVERVRINTTALGVLKQHIDEGLSGNENDDPYMMQARMGELWTDIHKLYDKIESPYNDEYEDQFVALYTERNALKEKLSQMKAANVKPSSIEQSKLDRIFDAVDALCDQPLDWDEQMVWQMLECIKVIDKNTLGIRFRWGDETEVTIG